MPDILIRDAKMPRNCLACSDPYEPFSMHRKCYVDGHVFCYSYVHGRDKDCPLVVLPEHGDLIDRDALIKMCNEISAEEWNTKAAPYSWAYAYESFVDDVEDIPVVIPAEKGETQ